MRYIIRFALTSFLALPLAPVARAEVPRVVTDIPPVGSLVAQVMGDLGVPLVLLDKGADPHAFQLRPSQAADLAQAGLIVWIGPEMTPWLERALNGVGTTGTDMRLLALPGTRLQAYTDPGEAHDDDHGDDHGDAHDDAHGDTGPDAHDHSGTDPHAWLDPENANLWLGAIAAQLSNLDPEHAATYGANAAAAQAALVTLEADLTARLAPAVGQPIVVFHNAYGYFTARFGLTVAGTIRTGDAAAPGAAHLRELQARIVGTPVCLFPETNHDPKLIASIATGTNARIGAALDPSGLSLPLGPALYAEMLRGLAGAIAECAAR